MRRYASRVPSGENAPPGERDAARTQPAGEHRRGGSRRQSHPGAQPAAWGAVHGRAGPLRHRALHGGEIALPCRASSGGDRVQARQQLDGDQLLERWRRERGRQRLAAQAVGRPGVARAYPADAQPGPDALGERAEVQRRAHRGRRRAADDERQVSQRFVDDQRDVALARQSHDPGPLLRVGQGTGRVVEVERHVGGPDAMAVGQLHEGVCVPAVEHRPADQLSAVLGGDSSAPG